MNKNSFAVQVFTTAESKQTAIKTNIVTLFFFFSLLFIFIKESRAKFTIHLLFLCNADSLIRLREEGWEFVIQTIAEPVQSSLRPYCNAPRLVFFS